MRPRSAAGRLRRRIEEKTMKRDLIPGIVLPAEQPNLYDRILTPAAVGFVAHLHRKYEERRRGCMKRRDERQARLDAGETFGFLPRRARSANPSGPWVPSRRTSRTDAWKSRGRPNARW